MLRTERCRLFLGLLALPCWSCADGAPSKRQEAPGTAIVPSAGKPATSRPADDDDAGGAAATENAGGAAGAGGAADTGKAASNEAAGGAGDQPTHDLTIGTELRVHVGSDAPTFVSLTSASQVDVGDSERGDSGAWDLVFQGWDIFTNGGASGGGKGAAFGPLPFSYFSAGADPTDVPFLIEDKAAGAFRDWYFYDGQWHTLYSRFHTYGVRSGERLFKLQLLGYYGDVQGAPISALYHLRYAEVTSAANGDIVEITKLDGSAGGLGGDDDAANGCLTLNGGDQQQLTPAQASKSSLWDLSFRRDSISVNGGLGGPGGVTAVDLDADATASETLDVVKARTADSESAAFASVDHDALTQSGLKYRGDRVVSAFTDAWADTSVEPPGLPDDSTWLVVAAEGKSRFLVAFTRFESSTAQAPGTVVMRIQKVR